MGNKLTFRYKFSRIIEGDRSFEAEPIHSEYVSPFLIVGLKSTGDFIFMGKLQDLTGQKFGRLTVLKFSYRKGTNYFWKCRCDCGNEIDVVSGSLKRGLTKSCGCYNLEKIIERNTKHNLNDTRLHNIWVKMKQRCLNSKDVAYKNYGARGISVCDKWLNDFKAFYDWAINNGYSDNLTIERINVNGNYCPENCTWITKSQQCLNTRKNVFLTYNGMTKTIKEWADYFNVSYSAFFHRVERGWDIDRIFNQPYRKGNNGKRKNI